MTFLFSLSKLKLSNLAPFFAFDLKFNFRTSFFFQPKSSEFSSCFFDFSEFSFFRKTGNGLDLILNKVSISDIFQSPVSWNFLKTTEYIFSKSELLSSDFATGLYAFSTCFSILFSAKTILTSKDFRSYSSKDCVFCFFKCFFIPNHGSFFQPAFLSFLISCFP